MRRPRIALSSRELHPFDAGSAAVHVALLARALAPVAEVTIVTARTHEEEHFRLRAAQDPRVDYGGATVLHVAVPGPEDRGSFHSDDHLYAHRVVERLRRHYGEVGPDLVEFSDRRAEGFVATQARRGGDPFFARTRLAVRLHGDTGLLDTLDGHLDLAFAQRVTRELEREALRDADVLLTPGGDVAASCRRRHGAGLAPTSLVRTPWEWEAATPSAADGPLRVLYAGPLERRHGVLDLIPALTGAPGAWRLTLAGADTPTAPLGRSVRRALELQAAGDPRIAFAEPAGPEALPALLAEHDLVVQPSRWAAWPHAVLAALAAGVPVVAPRVGGLAELVAPGVTGWLAARPGVTGLGDALAPLVADPAATRAATPAAALHAHLARLADPDEVRAAHLALAEPPAAARRAVADPPPLVTVVIPYYGMARYVEDALASVLVQTHPRLEVLVVDDGSFAPADRVLVELARRHRVTVLARPNGGLGAARNFGIAQSRGRYVLPLDADNVLEPTFVARCVALLEADDDLAFATSWNRYVDAAGIPLPAPNEGYRPVGNRTPLVEEHGLAGDGTSVFRRSVFDRHAFSEDLTSFEDWALFRALHRAGRYGRVIPEMLWRYRVREDSMLRAVGMPHERRLLEEMDALIASEEMAWVSTNG